MGATNFTKNALQDLFFRGETTDIAGEELSWSATPIFYVGLVGGADFPNNGIALRSTAYEVGNYAWPTASNGRLYKCTTAGTTGPVEPVWPETDGAMISDGSVIWTEQTLYMNAGHIPEPEGNGYVRQQWHCSLSTVMGGNLAASASPSNGPVAKIANLNPIQFPLADPNEWGPIWGVCFYDADEDGNALHFYPLEVPKVVGFKDQIVFSGGVANTAYGAIQITLVK